MDKSDDDADDDLEFCIECLEPLRYDDCGGYNPPCSCGLHCRSCHELAQHDDDHDDFDYRDDDDD